VPGHGVHAARFDVALVDALDALFAGGETAQAALVSRVLGGVA